MHIINTMYIINNINSIKNEIIDIKIDISKKEYIINRLNLKYTNKVNVKKINNINIISTRDITKFQKIIDIDYKIVDNLFIQEINIIDIPTFNFYEVDYEETYNEYTYSDNNINISMKEYSDYIIIDYIINGLENFLDNSTYTLKF